jgi:hypothetical protein
MSELATTNGQAAEHDAPAFLAHATGAGGGSSLAKMGQSREVAHVLASVMMAKQFPRDETSALTKIKRACNRPALAAVSAYSYKRGNQNVTGPSIRIAEAVAQAWGNVEFGWDEIERSFDAKKGCGISKVRAYARDLETNTFVPRTFDVPHWRDTRDGGYAIKEERDIYELCANMAARRVRACILAVIPGDVIDEAMRWCDDALSKQSNGKPLADRVRDMLIAFSEVGVTKEMIEARIQHNATAITEPELRQLGKVFTGIRDGMTTVAESFETGPAQPTTPAQVPSGDRTPATRTRKPRETAPRGAQEAPGATTPAEPPTTEAPADTNGAAISREAAIGRITAACSAAGIALPVLEHRAFNDMVMVDKSLAEASDSDIANVESKLAGLFAQIAEATTA